MKFFCPACGFDRLKEQPWRGNSPSDEICPSCGIHFGYDDFAGGNSEQRWASWLDWGRRWQAGGLRWFSANPPPEGWDPKRLFESIPSRDIPAR